jgi:hypothetical protein
MEVQEKGSKIPWFNIGVEIGFPDTIIGADIFLVRGLVPVGVAGIGRRGDGGISRLIAFSWVFG